MLSLGDTDACCTFLNSTFYDTNYNLLVISGPKTSAFSDANQQAGAACGEIGGVACSDYEYDNNKHGLGDFDLNDSEGISLKEMDKFVHDGHRCGLTQKWKVLIVVALLDTLMRMAVSMWAKDIVCLQSAITWECFSSGHFGYQCIHSSQ
jgi:hypothetical protein